jgi:hypothetical protein
VYISGPVCPLSFPACTLPPNCLLPLAPTFSPLTFQVLAVDNFGTTLFPGISINGVTLCGFYPFPTSDFALQPGYVLSVQVTGSYLTPSGDGSLIGPIEVKLVTN